VAAVPLAQEDLPAIHQKLIDEVNSKQSTWTAGVNSRFADINLRAAKSWMGVDMKTYLETLPAETTESFENVAVPDNFDSRTNWANCPTISQIRDQSTCGSCWAFGAVTAMSDRLCIATKAATTIALSAEDMLSCCETCGMGCNGGYPKSAWDYFKNTGLVADSEYTYAFAPCAHHVNSTKYQPCGESQPTPSCDKSKLSGKTYHAKSSYSVGGLVGKAAKIQAEIMTNGPVEGAFTVYQDFLAYKSGVYKHTSGPALGGHAIRIIGWGVENNEPYWLVANSWNESWGDNGLFKIARGSNECGIEGGVVAGLIAV
jgi:cathepsin B